MIDENGGAAGRTAFARDGDSPTTGTPTGAAAGEPTIVIEDEALRRGFTQLPNYLFQVRGLSHSAKLTYALILSYAWQKEYCFPGQETLARDLEVSTRSVIEYLKELQAHGLIRVQRRGLGLTNVYHVLRYPPSAGSTPPSHPEVKKSSHPRVKRGSDQDMNALSAPQVQSAASPEPQRSSRNKESASQNKSVTIKERQYKPSAAISSASTLSKHVRPTTSGSPVSSSTEGAQSGEVTIQTRMARAALVAHGIRNERLLDELSLSPAEVLAQVERLQQEVMRGGVTNPAGWLVEAIRGRYGEAAQDVGGTMMDRAEHPPAPVAAAVGSTPAAPGALAWQTVCAELRTEVTAENFERWFAPAVALTYDGQRLSIAVPDAFHQQWLDRRLRSTVERVASRVLRDTEIVFVVAGRASA